MQMEDAEAEAETKTKPKGGRDRVSHKQLERCSCGPSQVESVSYGLPDDSFISLTRCLSCEGLTDWTIRKHETKFNRDSDESQDTPSDDSEPKTDENTTDAPDAGGVSGFISFLGRETIALVIVGIGVTIFAVQWGFTMLTGAIALLSFLVILPLLYFTNSEY
ncbi:MULTISPECIES: hypothetical protein [Haloferacaceae]|uniref:Uncharacterized protein n=2 Tax=Haloferacaceae TaxID=1644056 RepID=A0ABD6DBR3_9EURY|nr:MULTISPECIES: hypothetical protein [Halorubraceae]